MVSCIHYFSCKIILFHYALLHKAGIWSLTKKAFTQGHMLICIQVLAVKKVMTTLILLNLRVTLERKDIRQKKRDQINTHLEDLAIALRAFTTYLCPFQSYGCSKYLERLILSFTLHEI